MTQRKRITYPTNDGTRCDYDMGRDSPYWNSHNTLCLRPKKGEWDGSPRCGIHLRMERLREERVSSAMRRKQCDPTVEKLEATRTEAERHYNEARTELWRLTMHLHRLDEEIARRRHDEGLPPDPPCFSCKGSGVRPTYGGDCVYCRGTGAADAGWRERQ